MRPVFSVRGRTEFANQRRRQDFSISSSLGLPKHFLQECIDSLLFFSVSSVTMTRDSAIQKRGKLAAKLVHCDEVLRGSILQRTTFHSSGCPKCVRGEGHPQWVLNVNYPGAKTRQLSLRSEQVP